MFMFIFESRARTFTATVWVRVALGLLTVCVWVCADVITAVGLSVLSIAIQSATAAQVCEW